MKYARSTYAYGFCDRCGFRYPLGDLREEVVNLVRTGVKVCERCFDPDHPQLRVGEHDFTDPMTLNDPRPDLDIVSSRGTFGWNPVGGPALVVFAKVGQVKVTIT